MILFNTQQIGKIKTLIPLLDSKFKYNFIKWANLNSNFKHLIQDFVDKDISRQDVINAYKAYYQNNEIGVIRAFLLTMIWGFGDTGYGCYRTNRYLSRDENILKIKSALYYIDKNNQDSLKNAFNELNKIDGLGISYLTKILYFATRAKYQTEYALIFDIRVATSLVKLTTPKEIWEIVNIGPSSKFKDYQNYNILIHKLAASIDVEADQLEMYLFDLDI